MYKKHILFALLSIFITNGFAQTKVSIDSLRKTVYFLASDSLLGRSPGSPEMAKATQYITTHFKEIQLKELTTNYQQVFHFYQNKDNRGTNIIGLIEGNDPILKNEYIVIGAHYDHIGTKFRNNDTIVYNGADDNASGVATILEVARLIQANKTLFKRSILVIAFDAEEQGLLGSTHFYQNCPVDVNQIKYMMSIDMVGALDKGGKLVFNGANSMKGGTQYFSQVAKTDSLAYEYKSGSFFWYSRTDTRPFYKNGVSSMYVSTGLKSPYHKPEDDANIIDYQGMQKSAEQIYNTTLLVANKDNIVFRKTEKLIEFGPVIGFGYNHFEISKGGVTNKNRLLLSGGITTHTRLGDNFALQVDAVYANRGSRTELGSANISSIDIPVNLLLMTPYDMARAYLLIGGYYNYALDGKIGGNTIKWSENNVNRNDFGLSIGFGMMVSHYQFTYKANFGTQEYLKNALPHTSYYRSLDFSVAYLF